MEGPARILLEGRPGVGKTTVALRLAELLADRDTPVVGFVTEELRERGRRVGFAVQALGGDRAVLAHVDLPGPPRVGKYGVDVGTFEAVALPALAEAGRGVVIVDEIGKMELASERFRASVAALLDQSVDLVATVHVARHPFTEKLKRRADVETIRVTHRNRDALPERLAARLAR
jgi:nucleoside-triphosphatase